MYRKGAQFERTVRKKLQAAGFQVVRSAGSKTPIDLIAYGTSELKSSIGKGKVLFIQCKTGNSKSISAIIRSKDVRDLIKTPLDADLKRVIRFVAMIRRNRITYQLMWTGIRWDAVQII